MRYFIVGFVVLLFIIFGIVIFSRSTTRRVTDEKVVQLKEYINNPNGTVRWTQDGPITASETHYSIRISVSPQTRILDVLVGYQGEVTRTQTLGNNTTAYGQFLAALTRSGFPQTRRSAYKDFTAVCPLGSRTTYEIFDGAETKLRTWSAPCVSGTFAGAVSTNATLFKAQIPNYSALTSGINVNGNSSTSIF